MSEYIHSAILPQMVNERIKATTATASVADNTPSQQVYEETEKDMLKTYGVTCICPSTVYWWMKHLGFKYEIWRKGYYVDDHEKPATLEYQWSFVQCYLNYE